MLAGASHQRSSLCCIATVRSFFEPYASLKDGRLLLAYSVEKLSAETAVLVVILLMQASGSGVAGFFVF
jgi:hypothetical protein